MTTITFGSVCSGIEAASVAWHRFGWRTAWLAEIETYPAKLLHHHYGSGRPHHMPDPEAEDLADDERDQRRAAIKAMAKLPLVPASSTTAPPNLGDMTRIEAMVRAGQVAAPDVLCGGTPCQGFSLAGLRGSLDDARGQLTLSFVRIADAIDTARSVQHLPPAVIVWENVFGVLSTKDNAFGNFLGALAGEDSPLEPPRTGWTNAGCVFGPRRTVAWRVYDAQYFGVAQRRRRVFVVASAREGVDPSEILLEFDGVRRDSPPRRSAPEDAAGTIAGGARRRGGYSTDDIPLTAGTITSAMGRRGGRPDCASTPGHLQAVECFGGGQYGSARDVAATLKAHAARMDFEGDNFLVQPVAGTLCVNGKGAGSATQQDAHNGMLIPIGFNAQQDPDAWMDHTGPLACTTTQAQAVCVAEVAGTLDRNHSVKGQDAWTGKLAVCITGDITHTLKAEGFDASEDGTGRGQPIVAAYANAGYFGSMQEVAVSDPLRAKGGDTGNGGESLALHGMAVRRMTPRECERLQDFPDDHTLVPVGIITKARAEKLLADGEPVRQDADGTWWKMAADGPRYKALGNSWAVANVVWLGRRLDRALRAAMMVAA